MKHSIKYFPLCWILVNSFLSNLLIGQTRDIPKLNKTNVLKITPMPILWGQIPLTSEFTLNGEVVLSKYQSSHISLSYLGKNIFIMLGEASAGNTNPADKLSVNGLRFQYFHKFYFLGTAPKGIYLAPHISYAIGRISTQYANQFDYYIRVDHLNIDGLLGYQVIAGHFALDVYGGLGYKKNTWTEYQSSRIRRPINLKDEIPFFNYYTSPVKIAFGVSIGAAF